MWILYDVWVGVCGVYRCWFLFYLQIHLFISFYIHFIGWKRDINENRKIKISNLSYRKASQFMDITNFFVHWHFYASRYRKTMRSKKHVIIQMQKLRKQSKFCGIKWNNKTAKNWNEKWILIWLFGNDNKRTQYNNCIPSLLQGAPLEITMIEPKQSVRLSSAVRGSEVQHLTFGVNASMGNKDGWRLLLLNWKSKQNAWRSNDNKTQVKECKNC